MKKPITCGYSIVNWNCLLPYGHAGPCLPEGTWTPQTLYLGGPIFGCTDGQARAWRGAVKNALSGLYVFRDPMDRDYRGREQQNARKIVDEDLAEIAGSDILLVNHWKSSDGTAMEMRAAYHEMGKHVRTIVRDPSPWIVYHSHVIYDTLGDAVMGLAHSAHEAIALASGRFPGAREP